MLLVFYLIKALGRQVLSEWADVISAVAGLAMLGFAIASFRADSRR